MIQKEATNTEATGTKPMKEVKKITTVVPSTHLLSSDKKKKMLKIIIIVSRNKKSIQRNHIHFQSFLILSLPSLFTPGKTRTTSRITEQLMTFNEDDEPAKKAKQTLHEMHTRNRGKKETQDSQTVLVLILQFLSREELFLSFSLSMTETASFPPS